MMMKKAIPFFTMPEYNVFEEKPVVLIPAHTPVMRSAITKIANHKGSDVLKCCAPNQT
jgi:bisphosphoglycerate-dependent phosphoglycerate mutase